MYIVCEKIIKNLLTKESNNVTFSILLFFFFQLKKIISANSYKKTMDFDKLVQMFEDFKKDLASFWEIPCKQSYYK